MSPHCMECGCPYAGDCSEEIQGLKQMLCESLSALEQSDEALDQYDLAVMSKLSCETRTWWAKHKELDRQAREHEARIKKYQQLRESGLSKLLPEERQALGIRE